MLSGRSGHRHRSHGEQDTNFPAIGNKAALSESTTFLNSANFNFDNLGPKRFLCLVLFLSR